MSILIKPIITEKATADSEMNNCYTFLVSPTSNKVEIKKAVEATYGVSRNYPQIWEVCFWIKSSLL